MRNRVLWTIIVSIVILVASIILPISVKNIVYDLKYISETERILGDNLEIEKKWLIDKEKIPYDLNKAEVMKIEQTYINYSPEIRVRKINDGQQYSFAVKTNMTSDGMIRNEIEEYISKEEYENMFKKREGKTIHKTRYQFLDGDYMIAIDMFSEDLEGLAYMEIEFENQEEANAFKTPDWVIKDVTDDLNYKNANLSKNGIPNSYYEYINTNKEEIYNEK